MLLFRVSPRASLEVLTGRDPCPLRAPQRRLCSHHPSHRCLQVSGFSLLTGWVSSFLVTEASPQGSLQHGSLISSPAVSHKTSCHTRIDSYHEAGNIRGLLRGWLSHTCSLESRFSIACNWKSPVKIILYHRTLGLHIFHLDNILLEQ